MKRIFFGLILFCLASWPCFGADIQDKEKNGPTKNQGRQERLAERAAEKEKKEMGKRAAQHVVTPIERRINDQQVSNAAAKIDAIIVSDLEKHQQQPGDQSPQLGSGRIARTAFYRQSSHPDLPVIETADRYSPQTTCLPPQCSANCVAPG